MTVFNVISMKYINLNLNSVRIQNKIEASEWLSKIPIIFVIQSRCTAEPILMKFRIHIGSNLEYHLGYFYRGTTRAKPQPQLVFITRNNMANIIILCPPK